MGSRLSSRVYCMETGLVGTVIVIFLDVPIFSSPEPLALEDSIGW